MTVTQLIEELQAVDSKERRTPGSPYRAINDGRRILIEAEARYG